jgi:hypothetical protein
VRGERVILVGDRGHRVRSFVSALGRFPREPHWVLVGGFAVNIRIAQVHRLTNDIDTVSRDQPKLVEVLLSAVQAERLDVAKLRMTGEDPVVDVDVMSDTVDVPLPVEPSERAFALARQLTSVTGEWVDLVVTENSKVVADAPARVATVASLVTLKSVAIPRRSKSNNPQKVGSDIHDLVRLVEGRDLDELAEAVADGGAELRAWVGQTLVKWFSPDQDLRYTFARLRRLADSADSATIEEDDLVLIADLGRRLLE